MGRMVKKDRLMKDREVCALLSRTRTSIFNKIKSGLLPPKVTIGGGARSSGFIYTEFMPYLDDAFEPEMVPYQKRVTPTQAAEIFSVAITTINKWVKWGVFPKPNKKCGVKGWAYGDVMKVLYGEYTPIMENGKPGKPVGRRHYRNTDNQ